MSGQLTLLDPGGVGEFTAEDPRLDTPAILATGASLRRFASLARINTRAAAPS